MTTETTRHTSHGTRTQLVTTAADVISRAMQQGRTLPAALAVALDSAQLLQSPDTAAEFEKLLRLHAEDGKAIDAATRLREDLRSRITGLEADREANDREYEAATARIAELESERHATNEALSDAAEQLRKDRDRLAELEAELCTAQAHGRTYLEQRNAHAKELLELRPKYAKAVAEVARLVLERGKRMKIEHAVRDEAEALRARVAELEAAQQPAEGSSYPSVLPWARLMDAEDLAEFLAEVEHAIATPGATPAEALAAVEKRCGTWRVIAEAQHAHNTAPGPDAETGGAS